MLNTTQLNLTINLSHSNRSIEQMGRVKYLHDQARYTRYIHKYTNKHLFL